MNSQESATTYYSDVGHDLWMGVTVASAPVNPLITDWVVYNSVKVLLDHGIFVYQVLHQPLRNEWTGVWD